MAICCADIHKLVHPYIDGEFSEEDRAAFERHVSECEPCRTGVDAERTFKDKLRAKLAPPKPGADLRARIATSLDEVDGLTEPRPTLLSWLVPSGAMAAAAAAIALFFLYPGAASQPSLPPVATGDSASAARANDFFIDRVVSDPVEVSVDQVRPEARRHAGISVNPPGLPGAEPVRAWVTYVIPERRAVRVDYTIRNDDSDETRTLHLFYFDPAGLKVNANSRRRINGTDVLCTSGKGMNRAYYTKNGVGFAMVSDLDETALLDLVRHHLSQD